VIKLKNADNKVYLKKSIIHFLKFSFSFGADYGLMRRDFTTHYNAEWVVSHATRSHCNTEPLPNANYITKESDFYHTT
jgi:hypothetical protein